MCWMLTFWLSQSHVVSTLRYYMIFSLSYMKSQESMCEGLCVIFFSFTHVDTYDWAEQLFLCVCNRAYVSGSLLAHEPEQCGLSRASFSLSHRPSIPCWPWCLWGGRAWPTSTTLTAARTSAISWQTQGPEPPPFTRIEIRTEIGFIYFLQCVRRYTEVEQHAWRIVSEAQNASACARSLLARRGLAPSLVRV